MDTGYPYRGQPSVVFSVPFTLGGIRRCYRDRRRSAIGSVDGTGDRTPRTMHAMDGTITDDPRPPRAAVPTDCAFRPGAELSPSGRGSGSRLLQEPVAARTSPASWSRSRSPIRSTLINGLAFVHRAARAACRIAQLRSAHTAPSRSIAAGDPAVLHQGSSRPGRQRGDGGPDGARVEGRPAARSMWTSAGWPRRRTTGSRFGRSTCCNRAGPHAVAELSPRRANQLHHSCSGPCFIATAAWGSALEPTVAAMRRARDRCWRRSRCSRSPPTSTAARGRRRPGSSSAATPPGSWPASFSAPWATTAEAVVPTK